MATGANKRKIIEDYRALFVKWTAGLLLGARLEVDILNQINILFLSSESYGGIALAKEGTDLKCTPLYPYYKNNNVKLIDFGSWALPVQFTKLSEEHQVVRERVGLFDVSHMGEIKVEGAQATAWLNRLITNDVAKVEPNQAVYTLVTNENGGILDDIIIFKLSDTALHADAQRLKHGQDPVLADCASTRGDDLDRRV
ncbi:MAG: hypothetical protein U5K84_07105 [Alkalibacterium sp.]|nr:hypothetical protein [Alkalibacterium sp.]